MSAPVEWRCRAHRGDERLKPTPIACALLPAARCGGVTGRLHEQNTARGGLRVRPSQTQQLIELYHSSVRYHSLNG
jgi:hypothetical protein